MSEVSHTKLQYTQKLIKDNWRNLLYVFVLNLLMLIPAAVSPIYRKVFTDYILTRNVLEWLPILLMLMIGTALFTAAITLFQKLCLTRLANKIEISGGSAYFWRLLRAPMSHFTKNDSSVLLSKMSATKGISGILTNGILTAVFALINAVFYLIMMSRIDWTMSLVVVGLIVVSYLLSMLQTKLMGRATASTSVPMPEENTGTLIKMDERSSATGLRSIETIKGSAGEQQLFQRLMNLKVATVHSRRGTDYSAASAPLSTFSSILFLNLLLFISALRIMEQDMTIGSYLAFQAYASAFFAPMNQMLNLRKQFKGYEASLKSFEGELAQQDAPAPSADVTSAEKLNGRIEFRDVRFGYDPEQPVIDGFNLTVEPGKRVAIVGQSGAGKSTIIKLLQGLYAPDAGQVLIDGRPVSEIHRATLQHSLGSANQQLSIFSASIKDNITLWDRGISDAEVQRAARAACLHEHIASLNGAYDYELIESGRNLSGGQRQRLEIARALLYDPSIVLMDEATSSLDLNTADRIEKHLQQRHCTLISATQSVGAIRDYDLILVLEDGQIRHQGTHEQLLNDSNYYASLFKSEGWMLS
ncbi:ATP-binding cassette domain-containing protein [Eubacteriales bacterium OttesenSCG-928-N13]|nr:ATP-binding cassette domain-containing protein [Eubacteriales bacterium OttesenSCG-928-N13]